MRIEPDVAIITPSYRADFERCRLLCESIDRFVCEKPDHFILVDDDDYLLFSQLNGPKRHIINECDIFPSWLKSIRRGVTKNTSKIWYIPPSLSVRKQTKNRRVKDAQPHIVQHHTWRRWPLRGWHVQQLRRIAIAHFIAHDGLLYCDSDMLFVRSFSTQNLWQGQSLRLYCKPEGINENMLVDNSQHKAWTRGAAGLFGLAAPQFPAHDYINNLVSWRRDHVLDMCHHLEQTSGKHWLSAIATQRTFSECQIYGAFVQGVLHNKGHWQSDLPLCETYWCGEALNAQTLNDFIEKMKPQQVAIGIQSFTNTRTEILRDLLAA